MRLHRVLVPLAAALPQPKHLKITQTPMEPSGFSDASVGQALVEGNEFLMAQFKNGEVQQGKEYSETYRQGLNALCVYALLHSAEATRDPLDVADVAFPEPYRHCLFSLLDHSRLPEIGCRT